MATLVSPDNPLIKRLARLSDGRHRREEGLFVVEGRRAISGFIEAGWAPVHLLVRDDETSPDQWPEPTIVSARVMDKLSQSVTAPGFLAAFALRAPAQLDLGGGGLVLAEVSDPGNVGTLVRTAAAIGISQIVAIGGADPWSHKAVQASAGALARVQMHELPVAGGLAAIASLCGGREGREGREGGTGNARLCALVAHGGVDPERLIAGPRWLVVGGEAHGIREEWLAACDERATLPMPGGTESLNAAIAGAIACYLLWRRPA